MSKRAYALVMLLIFAAHLPGSAHARHYGLTRSISRTVVAHIDPVFQLPDEDIFKQDGHHVDLGWGWHGTRRFGWTTPGQEQSGEYVLYYTSKYSRMRYNRLHTDQMDKIIQRIGFDPTKNHRDMMETKGVKISPFLKPSPLSSEINWPHIAQTAGLLLLLGFGALLIWQRTYIAALIERR